MYVVVVMFIIFKIIDKTIGLRVPAEVEIDGLDIHEHGLTSAYSGFSISDPTYAEMSAVSYTHLSMGSRGMLHVLPEQTIFVPGLRVPVKRCV